MEHTAGRRRTRQRKLIYEILCETKTHPTAEWVYERARERMPSISLGTVYRNLGVLKEEGLIRELRGMDRSARFDADLSPHAHFVCERCGRVDDVTPAPELAESSRDRLSGCRVRRIEVQFWGVCPDCLRTRPS